MPEEKGFLRIAAPGWPFVFAPIPLTIVFFLLGWTVAGTVLALLTAYIAFFFRDPKRIPPQGDDIAVSPADGRVLYIDEVDHEGFPDGRAKRVGIMLTIFNVHVNRAPLAGVVTLVKYQPGKFHNALFDKSSELNEHNRIGLVSPYGYLEVRQIAGAIARRIVCYKRPGDQLLRGGRIGMIRFGSRTEAYFPMGTEIWIQKGSRVKAGVTALGRVRASEKPS